MKKTISIILSFILIVSVFTACSNSDAHNANDEGLSDDGTAQIRFTIDSHYENTDESAVRAYEKVCTAVINGESEVKFNTSLLEDVHNLFYTSFPLFSFVESMQVLPDGSGISLTYKNAQPEHQALITQFLDKINEIMTLCEYGKVNTDRYIFNVYTYITSNFTLDNSVVTVADLLTEYKGYSAAICSLFEYLVLQGGGKASHVINISSSSMISAAEFKGQWYFFNPVLDIRSNQGKALTGFAMNSERAGNLEYTYTDSLPVAAIEDDAFDALKNSVSFELSDNQVDVACGDNHNFMLELN